MTADEAQEEWLAYKRERGQTYKQRGLTQLQRFRDRVGDERFVAAVEFSIMCNYHGLFEPKTPPPAAKDLQRPSLIDMDNANASRESR